MYNWCESPISESVWRCVLAVQVVSKWNHFCLLSASYMLCYLPIYSEPCSTCFFNSLHQRAPLHWAAGEDHVDAVRCLVDKGADINIKNGHSVSEWEYNVDCKLVLLFRVCTQPPSQWSGVHFVEYVTIIPYGGKIWQELYWKKYVGREVSQVKTAHCIYIIPSKY